jgi:hypothetical protein
MKTRVRHIVPLSLQARLLFDLQRPISGHTDLVFNTPNHRGNGGLRVISNGCLSMLLRRMGFQGRQTPHGFRGFGQTNCIEQLKIPRVVTEKQLAHADGNSVSRAYDWAEYLEERSDMLQRWADLLDQVAVAAGLAPVSKLSTQMAAQPSARQVDAYISTSRQEHGKRPRPSRGPGPRDLDARGRMDRKLRSKAGQAIYALRKIIVEPVFGQIKGARGSSHRGPLQNTARTSQ